jgi:4-hydroxy-tetrahydrodipicolinate synthase
MNKLVQGTYAAIITPRKLDGKIDQQKLRSWLTFLVEVGIQGFAINGATGEFCLVAEDEFRPLMETVADALRGKVPFLAGIGAAASTTAVRLGQIAHDAGARGLLLPMPYFFPYAQDDLSSFCRSVAGQLDSPVLLYNLPQFTSGLEPATSHALICECENIVGIKDSSGSLETLRLLTEESPDACRIVGNDGVLASALQEGLADGVISGVACVLPELIVKIMEARTVSKPTSELLALSRKLEIFIEQLDKLPTPWGIKLIAEARGLAQAAFPFPLSMRREEQARELSEWFTRNGAMLGCESA